MPFSNLNLENTTVVIGLAIFAAFTLIRLLEYLVKKLFDKKQQAKYMSDEEHDWLKNLYDSHNKFNEHGVPIWYMSSQLHESQQEIIKTLSNINISQEKITFILENIIKKLELK